MFEIKFRDDITGCNNNDFTSILDISHKHFICKSVHDDPHNNMKILNSLKTNGNEKLIFSNIGSNDSYYNTNNIYIRKYNDNGDYNSNIRKNARIVNNEFYKRYDGRTKCYIRKRYKEPGR